MDVRHGHPTRPDRAPRARTDPGSALSFERLVFFSDAVFAIVITLLVLPLTAEIEVPESRQGLAAEVLSLWPTVVTFVVSFLVVASSGSPTTGRSVGSAATTTPSCG